MRDRKQASISPKLNIARRVENDQRRRIESAQSFDGLKITRPSPPKVTANPAVQRLPEMTLDQIQNLWINAVRLSQKKATKDSSLVVLDAIEAEWLRRSRNIGWVEGYFVWPSTIASQGKYSSVDLISGSGMLSYMGYHVGRGSSLSTSMRHAILDGTFSSSLPPAFPKTYMDQWSAPNSALRLKKLAHCISSFARNGKRRRSDVLGDAIIQWEADLEYLYRKYYVAKFNFGWPR